MKKIYLMAAMLISGATVFAQGTLQNANSKVYVKKVIDFPVGNPLQTAAPGDTAGISANYSPVFNFDEQASLYGYLGGGFVFGNNADGLNECAQGYLNNNQTPVDIEEVILWFGGKVGVSADVQSKCVVKVWSMALNKARNTDGSGGTALNSPGPNQLLASQDLFFDDIDTSDFNSVSLSSSVFVNGGDFAISVDFSNMNTKGDTAGLVCDAEASAQELDYAFHKISGAWWVTDHAFSDPAVGTGGLDVNIAIWAVISDNVGIEDQGFISGLKLSQNNPNPMNGNTVIQYELEKYTTAVELEIYDVHGRKAVVINEGEKTAGRHSISIENTKLAAGTYYYSLKANGNRLTKKMVVTK